MTVSEDTFTVVQTSQDAREGYKNMIFFYKCPYIYIFLIL